MLHTKIVLVVLLHNLSPSLWVPTDMLHSRDVILHNVADRLVTILVANEKLLRLRTIPIVLFLQMSRCWVSMFLLCSLLPLLQCCLQNIIDGIVVDCKVTCGISENYRLTSFRQTDLAYCSPQF